MGSHLLHLVVFSALVSLFFAVWAGSDRRSRLRIGLGLFGGMVVASLVLAWLTSFAFYQTATRLFGA